MFEYQRQPSPSARGLRLGMPANSDRLQCSRTSEGCRAGAFSEGGPTTKYVYQPSPSARGLRLGMPAVIRPLREGHGSASQPTLIGSNVRVTSEGCRAGALFTTLVSGEGAGAS